MPRSQRAWKGPLSFLFYSKNKQKRSETWNGQCPVAASLWYRKEKGRETDLDNKILENMNEETAGFFASVTPLLGDWWRKLGST